MGGGERRGGAAARLTLMAGAGARAGRPRVAPEGFFFRFEGTFSARSSAAVFFRRGGGFFRGGFRPSAGADTPHKGCGSHHWGKRAAGAKTQRITV